MTLTANFKVLDDALVLRYQTSHTGGSSPMGREMEVAAVVVVVVMVVTLTTNFKVLDDALVLRNHTNHTSGSSPMGREVTAAAAAVVVVVVVVVVTLTANFKVLDNALVLRHQTNHWLITDGQGGSGSGGRDGRGSDDYGRGGLTQDFIHEIEENMTETNKYVEPGDSLHNVYVCMRARVCVCMLEYVCACAYLIHEI